MWVAFALLESIKSIKSINGLSEWWGFTPDYGSDAMVDRRFSRIKTFDKETSL